MKTPVRIGLLCLALLSCGLRQGTTEHVESAKAATARLFKLINDSDAKSLHRLTGADLSGKYTVADAGSHFHRVHQYV